MDIDKKVKSLINLYGTNCPFKLAKQLGVHVEFENLGSSLGYYTKVFRIPIIKINENASEKQQIFICGHELGHHILHPNANTPFMKKNTFFSTDKMEIEAHTFSINLLFSNENMVCESLEEYGIPKHLATLIS